MPMPRGFGDYHLGSRVFPIQKFNSRTLEQQKSNALADYRGFHN